MAHAEFIPTDFKGMLAHMVEEMAEALVEVGKTQRFGPFSVNPLLPKEEQVINLIALMRELKDVADCITRFQSYAISEFGYKEEDIYDPR